MKVVAVEGTPEEMARLQELTGFLGSGQHSMKRGGIREPTTPVPDEIARFMEERAGLAQRAFVEQFLKRAIELGTVATLGKSKHTADGRSPYAMLHDSGPRRLGAAAYVRPTNGVVTLRLRAEAAEGRQYAYAVRTASNHEYQVRIQLHSPHGVDEAVELLQRALKEIRDVHPS